MQWYDQIKRIKVLLIIIAVIIAVISLVASHLLVKDLAEGERKNMEVWAQAMRTLNNADQNTDVTLVLEVLNGNNTIPVIVLDSAGYVQSYRNLQISADNLPDSLDRIRRMADHMKTDGKVIRMELSSPDTLNTSPDYLEICYGESIMIQRLSSYPYIQLGVVLVFVIVAIFALLSSKRAEQNKVWVGLSKETAHQLGTPISSLMGWVEVLRETYPEDQLIPEMDKDVKRLELIAERFSKIGSMPELKKSSLSDVLHNVVNYISHRTSDKVQISCVMPENGIEVMMCASLFEWVVENLCKNAIDAMDGKGSITIKATEENECVLIDVTDTGKGISKKHFKTVFSPGFTTKKRGWGLGLSLAKRIVEEYHRGKIYVKSSEIGSGTTFRIELKKAMYGKT